MDKFIIIFNEEGEVFYYFGFCRKYWIGVFSVIAFNQIIVGDVQLFKLLVIFDITEE